MATQRLGLSARRRRVLNASCLCRRGFGLLQGAELGRVVIDPAKASLLPDATLSRIRF